MTKIYSWNVNGIRAVMKKGMFEPFIKAEQPDILCLQEIKSTKEQFDKECAKLLGTENCDVIKDMGYEQFWYPAMKPGYSGTALLSKQKVLQIRSGMPEDLIKKYGVTGDVYGDPNLEGRVLAAEFDKFWVVSVYTPNAKDDLSRLDLRHKQWDPAFLAYMKRLEETKPVIFCGDLNVAHTEDDLANPKPNRGKKGFTDEEREGFQNYLDAGLVDTFRIFTQGNGHYSWWSHFANARARNVGWRIDYLVVSESLKPKVKAADIHTKYMGSDHCPVSITLAV